jgi:hypothetical protein
VQQTSQLRVLTDTYADLPYITVVLKYDVWGCEGGVSNAEKRLESEGKVV